MHTKAPRNPNNGNRLHVGAGRTVITEDMLEKIARHIKLRNPTRTARILGYMCNSGSALNRILGRKQHTIRPHFFEKLEADLKAAESELEEQKQAICIGGVSP